MFNVNVDLIGANGETHGEIASLMAGQGRLDPNRMRPWLNPQDGRSYITVFKGGDPKVAANYQAYPITANATLRRDEWKQLDEAVLRVSESRLKGVQDLKSRGLTYNLSNAMGTTVLEYHDVSNALQAGISMDGIVRQQNDRVEYGVHYIPLPIVHVDYELNERVLENSRRMGNPLDSTLAERASRKVSETLEEMLFTDTTYGYGGGTIYSYVNHPYRNKVSGLTNWTDSGKSASDIRDDVLEMKQQSIDANHYGPWILYIPTGYETVLDEDYDNTRGNTIRQRLMAIDGIEDIKVIDKLPANNIVLVEMSMDVIRWVNGMGIQNVQWQQEGGMVHKFKVMTIQVPQIRADYDNKSGVVHLASSH